MRSEREIRRRIFAFALPRFLSEGYSSVTVDEIARGLGMGKGTVYKYVPSKEELLVGSISLYAEELENEFNGILSDGQTSDFEKLNIFLNVVSRKLGAIRPAVLEEIGRMAPDAYEKIEELRSRLILENITKLLEKGKASGLYRKDLDSRLLAFIVIGAARQVSRPEALQLLRYPLDGLFRGVLSSVLLGCLTEEGRARFLQGSM